jgi:hypothetical protein
MPTEKVSVSVIVSVNKQERHVGRRLKNVYYSLADKR